MSKTQQPLSGEHGLTNVVIIGPTESLLTKRGNRHPSLAAYLVEAGYKVSYLTSNFYHAEKRFFDRDEIRGVAQQAPYPLEVVKCLGYRSNVSVRRVLSNTFLSIAIFVRLLFRRSLTGSVVVIPSRPVELIFLMGLLRRLRRIRILIDIQDVWPDAFPMKSGLKKTVFTTYCNVLLRRSLSRYDHCIHVAPGFVDWLHRYAPQNDSTFVPLGYDPQRWCEVDMNMRLAALSDETPIKLVCVGQLQRQIDVLPLVKLIGNDQRWHLTIIGENGQGERCDEVKKYIDQERVSNVTFVGVVPPDQMPMLLAKMHIGVVPMITTSIPNKVFDYIASWLPTLVIGAKDAGEFVCSNKLGWFSDYDAEQLESVLKAIVDSDLAGIVHNVDAFREKYSRPVLFGEVRRLIDQN
ncbi:MAG: glycosyltransferase [Rubripirellula sp.]